MRGVPVLVVDDDATSAKLVAVILRGEGCDVRVVGSAEEALAALSDFLPRAMVIDVVLPLMSGLLLAQRLKARPETAGIVLVAVTAFNGPDAERVVRSAGFAAYVRKPIDPMSFASLLLAHLAAGRAE